MEQQAPAMPAVKSPYNLDCNAALELIKTGSSLVTFVTFMDGNYLQGTTTITKAKSSASGFILGNNFSFRKFQTTT
jgi:hypothetical protein